MKKFRIQPPIYLFVSILDAKGYRILYINHQDEKKITAAIDRNILSLPEVEIKDYNFDLKEKARLIFNMIWNSCGEKQSINFSNDGKWIGEKFNINN